MNTSSLLGFIGVLELIIILLVMLVMLAVVGGLVWLVVYLVRRSSPKKSSSPPPMIPATAVIRPPSHCPHCGKALTAASVQGICPECLLQAGLGTQGPDALETKFTPPALEQLAPLFPQLELLELLGRGGMGAVYKARQRELNRLVALKVLPADKAERDPAFAERFAREARALAALNHPNIVTVFDHGQAGGHCWLLMEYVDGLSLRQFLQRGSMKPEEAIAIVPRICEALQFAHQHGIVHRDIKPENILVDTRGRVKIADFGIAKIAGSDAERANLTEPRQTIGTPHYMAPEQVEKPSTVDHRADIYSLGVVFYEMLTGELPLGKFASPSQKVQVDVRLDEIVLRALEKEPARRYQQASQVKTAVETMGSTPPTLPTAMPPQSPVPGAPPRSSKIRPWVTGLITACVAALVLLPMIFCISILTPKTYEATAKAVVMVDDRPHVWSGGAESSLLRRTIEDRIHSDEFLDLVLTQLNFQITWSEQYGGNETLTPSALREFLKTRLQIRFRSGTASFEVSAFSESSAGAAAIANAVAENVRLPETLGQISLVSRADPPTHAVRPNIAFNMFLGFLVSLAAGLFAGTVVWLFSRRRSRRGIALMSADSPLEYRYQQASQVKTAVETMGSLQAPKSYRPQTVGLRQALRESSWPAMKWGLLVLVLILGLGVAVTLVTPKTYQATVRLYFPGSDAPRLDDPFDLQTLHAKIKHPEIISNVVAKLDLQNRWSDRFGSGFNGMKTFGYLQASLQIRRSRDSSNLPSIDLMVFSESSDEAAEIADAVAETFATTAPGRPTTVWNPAQTEQLRPNLWLNVGLAFVLGTFIGAVVAAGYVVARAARRTHQASVGSIAQLASARLQTDALNYRSKATLFGLPWLHVVEGIDPETGHPRVARGIIAIGPRARGIVAVGGRAVGVFACGGLALGVFAFGGCAFGLVTLGGVSVALGLATGGLAVAPVAMGGMAVGLYALGGGAYALHGFGGNVRDAVARAFFTPWGFWLMAKIGPITVALLLLMLPFILLPGWLRRRQSEVGGTNQGRV